VPDTGQPLVKPLSGSRAKIRRYLHNSIQPKAGEFARLRGVPYDCGVRPSRLSRAWIRWLNLAAVVRLLAVVLSVQLAAIAPAVASVTALLSNDAAQHCACCNGKDAHRDAAEEGVPSVHATDEDCGGCPPDQSCTDCPAGCASCHSATSARLLLPSAISVVISLAESFDSGVIAERQSPRSPFLSSLERPPKQTLAV
jgi:hypothetical protein